jgi:hypothetical protein
MDESIKLGLPLLQPAQAQKHVTVNEALVRLDGLTHLTLASVEVADPPGGAAEGAVWAVPAGGTGDWAGEAGRLAIRAGGGWVFVPPQPGWRAWIADRAAPALFDGAEWVAGAVAVSPHQSVGALQVAEFDHVLGAGASSTTTEVIPANAMVFAATARIVEALTGTLTSWKLGVAGATDRYGAGMGLAAGSWVSGITGQPVTYYADTPLLLSATGGDFSGGTLRVALHYFTATPPSA